MALDQKHIGRKYGPYKYEVGLEKLREFAYAVGGGIPSPSFGGAPEGLDRVLWDEKAAKETRHEGVIASPTFAAVFAIAPFASAIADPELGVNFMMLVHGEQSFELHDVVRPGDVLYTLGTVVEIYEKRGNDFLTVHTETKRADGARIVDGRWTAVIRRASAK